MKRLLVCVGFAALALAGCSGDSTDKAAPTTAPTADESTVPQTGPAPTKPGASPQAGCPVDAATLEKAFHSNAQLESAVVLGAGLKDISCYQDYATALTQPPPNTTDTAVVLFNYDTTKKMWVALTGGTDGVCAKVPPAVLSHLKNCAG